MGVSRGVLFGVHLITDQKVNAVCFCTGEFPYAKCFICGEIGHLTRSCPDNPRGLYPRGLPHPLSFVHLD